MHLNLQKKLMQFFFETCKKKSPQLKAFIQAFQKLKIEVTPIDHFAIIDLPSKHSGIPVLKAIFEAFGFTQQGAGYLEDKQNDFIWMTSLYNKNLLAEEAIPQVVLADFRLAEMPPHIQNIISKYASLRPSFPFDDFNLITQELHKKPDNISFFEKLLVHLTNYFFPDNMVLPTLKEYQSVLEYNELLAWVLVFGKRPNHFTFSIHLFNHFTKLSHLHSFIEQNFTFTINKEGGAIKGNPSIGLEQSSTIAEMEDIQLQDAKTYLPADFIEFVWRYPKKNIAKPSLWQDYYSDFIPAHANRIIESIYTNN